MIRCGLCARRPGRPVAPADGVEPSSAGRWTRRKTLGYCVLDCKLLLVPIHKGGDHWVLVSVDLSKGSISYLDSLHGEDRRAVVRSSARDDLFACRRKIDLSGFSTAHRRPAVESFASRVPAAGAHRSLPRGRGRRPPPAGVRSRREPAARLPAAGRAEAAEWVRLRRLCDDVCGEDGALALRSAMHRKRGRHLLVAGLTALA